MTQPPSQQPSSGPLSPQHGVPTQGGMPSPGAPGPQSAGIQGGYSAPDAGYTPTGTGHSAPQSGSGTPAKKPSKAPKVLIILGSVILALSVIIGVVMAVIGFGGAVSGLDDLEVFDSGSGTISAEAGDSLQIYVEEGAPVPSCTVDGPSVGEGTSQNSTAGTNEATWVSVDSFTAETAGEYMITCDGGPIAVGPPLSVGGIFAGVGGILLAIVGGALGLLLLAIGVILLIVRRSRA